MQKESYQMGSNEEIEKLEIRENWGRNLMDVNFTRKREPILRSRTIPIQTLAPDMLCFNHLACCSSQWHDGWVWEGSILFWASSTFQSWFECHSQPDYRCWLCASLYLSSSSCLKAKVALFMSMKNSSDDFCWCGKTRCYKYAEMVTFTAS